MSVMGTAPTTREGIRLVGLTKSFGAVRAVRGVDINVAPGQTLALLGPNGAGKSTTIDMMLGLSHPDSGAVTVFGVSPSDAVRAGSVGAMLQTGSLIEFLSVRELITMIAAMYPHPLAIDEVLSLVGMTNFANRPSNKLSGGQTQRVRMAIALIGDPSLFVLDEPTAALDVEGRREFWTAMRSIAARGKTIVFATHYLEEADTYADRVVLMARGGVVAEGTPTEIKARVGGRTIRATLPNVDQRELTAISGVSGAEFRDDAVLLTCRDSPSCDRALRELLHRFPYARDIEVRGAGLEEAFLNLTSDGDQSPSP